MKNIKYLLGMLLAVCLITSCQNTDTPKLTSVTAPTLNALSQDTLYANDSSNPYYTFTWSAPRFNLNNSVSPTSVGSFENQGINYDLQIDTLGGNFSKQISVGQVVSALYMNVKATDLEQVASDTFKVKNNTSVDLQFRLVATYGSTSKYTVVSQNVIRATLKMPAQSGGGSGSGDHSEPDFNDGLTHTIYVQDNTGWSDLSLYAWNETGNMLAWPGVHYSKTVMMGGITWKEFEMPSDYQHRAGLNWIFNDNNQGHQFNAMSNFTFGHDLFITISSDGTYVLHPGPVIANGGFTVYANIDQSGWSGISFYAWYGSGDFDGSWPGHNPDGSVTVNGKLWYYHTFLTTELIHVILNNQGNGKQAPDLSVNWDIYATVGSDNNLATTSGVYK